MWLPPEWWPQAAVMLTWPHAHGDWGDQLPSVERVFVDLAAVITRYQKLIVTCTSEHAEADIRAKLTDAGAAIEQISFGHAPSNDVWVRDHGPITVLDNQQAELLDFRFNGWGGKYESADDNRITRQLFEQGLLGERAPRTIDRVIEGGAIEVNGAGVLLTTRNCLTLSSRNPGLDEAALESYAADWFGCHTVHWLAHGHLQGDDTDGHVDTIARFCAENRIVYQGCDDPDDCHFTDLQAMAGELSALRNPQGQPYELHALPLPAPIYADQGQRLPAGYANFLIINQAVLMPSYNDPADEAAAAVLRSCFPDRVLETVDCRALVQQFGSLHCATMQLPAELSHRPHA